MARQIKILVACILFLPLLANGQIVTEEEIITDSIDVFKPAYESKKSPQAAMAQSILLPGLGHQYLGSQVKALRYFTAEAIFLFGAILCNRYSSNLFDDSRSYAKLFAGASGGAGADDNYWQNIGSYLDFKGYNRVQELNRIPRDKYVQQHLQWQWIDESFMDKYGEIRETATRFQVVSNFFIGAMILNRLISFIDVRASTKYKGIRGNAGLQLYPQLSSDLSSVGVYMSATF